MGNRDLLETLVGLHEAGRIMGSTLDGAEIGRRMLQILDSTLGLTAGIVHVYEDSGRLCVLGSRGLESPQGTPTEEVEVVRRRALETETQQSLEMDGNLAAVFVPLRAQSRVIGLVEAYGPSLNRESEEFLSSLCTQAAIALDNSRLYEKLLEHEQRLENLVDRMVRTQEDERRRVAHEIHDGLTQTLIAINHHLQVFSEDFASQDPAGQERLDRILQLAHSATDESQRITFGLRPTVLEDFGVGAAIRSEVESLEAQGFQVSYTNGLGELRLPEGVEITLYRIAQEALANVRKHARVDSAELALYREGGEVRLRISDRGVGFDPTDVPDPESLGLIGMRERAELIGGRLELESRPGFGAEIKVAAPHPEGGNGGG